LLEQPFVKDEDRTVAEIFEDVAARMGEKMLIRRFVRYELGEELD
jgi:elongation factor Ts